MIATMHQPQYLPYMGLVEKVKTADLFIISDTSPYAAQNWQNRNRIKTPNGLQWLTVPIVGKEGWRIKDIKVNNQVNWKRKHLNAIKSGYGKARYFKDHEPWLDLIYNEKTEWESLADLDIFTMYYLLRKCGVSVEFRLTSQLQMDSPDPTEWIIQGLKQVGATAYVSGIHGKEYLKEDLFAEADIQLMYHEYYPDPWLQLWGEFDPWPTALDYVLNCCEE